MCGIAGQYLVDGRADHAALGRALDRLAHRGPDDHGIWEHENVSLAHTRLSIIDLAGGHQPLLADDGNLVLVVNGEIYNYIELREELEAKGHRFGTRSDSETILHAYAEYGLDLFRHLCGMYAFALYDRRRRRLVLARDRLGIKPLFFSSSPRGVAFASELKALLPLLGEPPRVDPTGLMQYLQIQFTSGAHTVLRGVERVQPGEYLVIEDGRLSERRTYWSARSIEPTDVDFDAAAARFDPLFETVMRQHMRSDVPFGLFLSGGVDSSILLAMLSRLRDQPVHSYSVGFPDSKLASELPIAARSASRYGSPHEQLTPGRDDLLAVLPDSIWAADDLMRDYASLPTLLLARHAVRGQKVLFSGEGGDEVFGGYRRYHPGWMEDTVKRLLHPQTGGFRVSGLFEGRQARRLFGDALYEARDAARLMIADAWQASPSSWSRLQRRQYVDIATALPDNLLVKADRMLMRAGAEGRVPFLDHRIVEFGLALPDRLKVRDGQGKHFLKRWAERHVDRDVLHAKKRGFYVPLRDCFGRPELERLLLALPRQRAISDWFRPDAVRALLQQDAQRGQISQQTFALFQFALWHGFFIEGRPQPALREDPVALLEQS